MKSLSCAGVALAISLAASPASSAILQYTLTGTDSTGAVQYASFRLDSNPVVLPNNVGPGEGFRLKRISGVFQYDAQVETLRDLFFYNDAVGGGFNDADPTDPTNTSFILALMGPQLYEGSESAPTMLTGEFTLFDAFDGSPIALSVAAVPEPASWAMMISGFALAGAGVRRGRSVSAQGGRATQPA